MKTFGLFDKTYGRFEFRAALPQGQGYWPALWMMPQDSVYGGWAASGEIDVTENRGSDPTTVLGTIHFGGQWPNNLQSHGPSFTFPAGDSVTNFHTYALEWTTNAIKWFVDDQLYETQTSWSSTGGGYPAPFDQPFYIIMNLAVGGNFGGNPDTNTLFPGEMLVDYVRAYDFVTVQTALPALKMRFGFDDSSAGTTSASDSDTGTTVSLQMVNGSGVATDYHGAAGSGVSGLTGGDRALNFSSNGANQPGNPGPLASVTSTNLGFGAVSNFVVSFWFRQNAMMATGPNVGPRMFILGAGTPSDAGVTNSIGVKFQTANQLYFQMNNLTVPATFSSNLPTQTWIFFAAVYDGSTVTIYQGTDANPVTTVTNAAASTSLNLGSSAGLCVGNRQNRQRSFDGWIDDLRFYTGAGDSSFVEGVRLAGVNPSIALTIQPATGNHLTLGWPFGVLQSAGSITGNWSSVTGATAPFLLTPTGRQQFFRVQLQ
jgi:hypothetical protein